MKHWALLIALMIFLALLLACGPGPVVSPVLMPTETTAQSEGGLTPNPVETSEPIYGGILVHGGNIPSTFDGYQDAGYGPTVTLPVFNQLVMMSLDYKETVYDNIVGDLADSWEISDDGTEITFYLHPGVKWHDGVPFTADDVVYSLDRMTDPNSSVIYSRFPAYASSEKIDDNTVLVHLKYPSAGFLVALTSGESVIQAKHLAGIDGKSTDFLVGTGPFMFDDFILRVHIKYKRNPNYFKKDKYGNQLPYLDGHILMHLDNKTEPFIARRLDVYGIVLGPSNSNLYMTTKDAAPDALVQKKVLNYCTVIKLNMDHKPLDDIRVRRALGLILDEESLVVGFSGDPSFGLKDVGLISGGLPPEEVRKIMGWDKPYEERIAEAQRLMTEAGYPNGFYMFFLSHGAAQAYTGYAGANLVFAEALKQYLNMNVEVRQLPSPGGVVRRDTGDYDAQTDVLSVGDDPALLKTYFGTGEPGNYSHYSNPKFDEMIDKVDMEIDPVKRHELILDIERLLLTDLPALPTGIFSTRMMFYYPHVKNLRWTYTSYSNICRLEDVWIDPSLKSAAMATGY
ncbi:ABC transporter substrate-binding protein [candidate division WS5 bacterium]|uniref:ABC transporter substrate-binding protein n=1 Tax=candidate division WS5 bacterium TaxID=2093353 RepID=A0A419DAM1_9BACT|nr:MAG: ABC transporter substrate-binding protein [candidate division WS5 bacterium]